VVYYDSIVDLEALHSLAHCHDSACWLRVCT